jgi:hypothetical protein
MECDLLLHMNKITFIPEAELEDRRVYLLRSRNLRFGAWDAETGSFYGVREKFGDRYIDNEYQWGERSGTAHAREALDLFVPDEILMQANLWPVCRYCGGKTESIMVEDEDFKARNIYKGMKCIGNLLIDPAEAAVCEYEGTHMSWLLGNANLLAFMEQVEADNEWVPYW